MFFRAEVYVYIKLTSYFMLSATFSKMERCGILRGLKGTTLHSSFDFCSLERWEAQASVTLAGYAGRRPCVRAICHLWMHKYKTQLHNAVWKLSMIRYVSSRHINGD